MRGLLSFTLVTTALTGIASAQDAELRQKEVVISMPGPDRAAGEMVSSVSDISREEIVADLQTTLGDTLDRQPGVSTTYFGAGASRPVLRGLGAERVLVLTNGIGAIDVSAASPDHQAAGDGIDAENIEILRGPAALAYGGQAIGGVVNVIDGLIVDELPAEQGVSGNAFIAGDSVNNGVEYSGRISHAVGPWVLTLSGSGRDFEDYDIPGFAESSLQMASEAEEEHEDEDEDHEEEEEVRDTLPNSFVETGTLAAGLSWIGDNAHFGFAIRKQTAEYGLPGHDHAHEHEEDEGHDAEDEDHEEEGEEENPYIDLEHVRYDLRGGFDFDTGFLTHIDALVSYADYEHTEFEAPGEPGTRYETDGVEARLELGNEFGGFEGAFGLQYLDKSLAAFGDEAFITPTDTKTIGAFIYEARDWDDGFGVEGGLRIENVEYDNQAFGDASFDLVSGSLGLHKHWESGIFLGLQVAHTERAPNESELFALGAHLATDQYEVGSTDLDKETALNLEATLRWENASSSIGASIYSTSFSDFIYLTPGMVVFEGALTDEADGVPVYLFQQQDADFAGFEIYGSHEFESPFAGAIWSVDGNIDYVDGELSDGGNVPYLPPLTFNGSLNADWQTVNASAEVTLADEQDKPGEGTFPTDGYALFGLKFGVNAGEIWSAATGVEAFVDIRNITDEEVRYSTSVLKDTVPAPGRNVRFGVKASF